MRNHRLNVLNEFPNNFCRVHFAYIGCIYVEYHAVIKVIHACRIAQICLNSFSRQESPFTSGICSRHN